MGSFGQAIRRGYSYKIVLRKFDRSAVPELAAVPLIVDRNLGGIANRSDPLQVRAAVAEYVHLLASKLV